MSVAEARHPPGETIHSPPEAPVQSVSTWAQKTTCQKIWTVVKAILMIAAAIPLCIYSPTIFVASFVIGIIFSKHVAQGVDKVKRVLTAHPWIAALVIGGFCLIGLHATLLVGSALLGAHLGSLAYELSKKHLESNKK
jgi:hypothetical protein